MATKTSVAFFRSGVLWWNVNANKQLRIIKKLIWTLISYLKSDFKNIPFFNKIIIGTLPRAGFFRVSHKSWTSTFYNIVLHTFTNILVKKLVDRYVE